MKVVNKICRFAAIVFGVGALVLFFTRFAAIVSGENTVNLVGAQLDQGCGRRGRYGKVVRHSVLLLAYRYRHVNERIFL